MTTQSAWNGKNVLITGGTSGLGLALATQLLEKGAKVAVLARHPAPVPRGAHFIQGDIGDKKQIHRIFAEAISHLGSINLLFNNASTLGPTPMRLLLDTECEDLSSVIETNVLGPFRLSKLVAAQMVLDRDGVIVNISSDAAVNGYPTWGAYGISKAALDQMTRVFAAELTEQGVHFAALDPGDMDTPLHLAAVPNADRSSLHQPSDSARLILEQLAQQKFEPVRRGIR